MVRFAKETRAGARLPILAELKPFSEHVVIEISPKVCRWRPRSLASLYSFIYQIFRGIEVDKAADPIAGNPWVCKAVAHAMPRLLQPPQ